MADMDYFGAEYGVEEPAGLVQAARNFGLANWAGALTSLGLIGGMAFWVADTALRDVSDVPVILALEGPMRVAPENPGGKVAPFQGMALSDITSGGPAAPAPDQIVLAPPPVALDAAPLGERLAAADRPAPPAAPEVVAEAAPVAQPTPRPVRDVAPTVEVSAIPPATDAPLPKPLELVSASAPATTLTATPAVALVEALPAAEVGAVVARTERPRRRPAARVVAAAAAPSVPTDAPEAAPGIRVASVDPAVPTVRDVDPATIAAGTRVVQLGAFDSEAVARAEWDRLYGRFGDFMAGKSRMIQKANSGGRDFWRLRVVGFDDASEARRFCSTLLARDAACIPVTMR
ncbi:MAG: SPOR domain-containing protein [Pseudomonadota bacterium]